MGGGMIGDWLAGFGLDLGSEVYTYGIPGVEADKPFKAKVYSNGIWSKNDTQNLGWSPFYVEISDAESKTNQINYYKPGIPAMGQKR
jgi:hypothetical protein